MSENTTKLKRSPDFPESKETDQDFTFWEKSETWDKHLTSEEEALKSFDLMEKNRAKLSPIERRYTSNQLERKYGRTEGVRLILNEVNNGRPPISSMPKEGAIQLRLNY